MIPRESELLFALAIALARKDGKAWAWLSPSERDHYLDLATVAARLA